MTTTTAPVRTFRLTVDPEWLEVIEQHQSTREDGETFELEDLDPAESLRVRFAIRRANTWAENLRHAAETQDRYARQAAEREDHEAKRRHALRASGHRSHADTLEDLARILSGEEDHYLRALEATGNLD